MNKKLLLTTTIAGSMFIAGMANPTLAKTVKTKSTDWIGTPSIAVELEASDKGELTFESLKAKVEGTITKVGETEVTAEYDVNTKIGNGTKITLDDGTEYTVVVYGDADGSGKIDVYDAATALKAYADILGEKEVSPVTIKASDITGAAEEDFGNEDIAKILKYATSVYAEDVAESYVDEAKFPVDKIEKVEYDVVKEAYSPSSTAIQGVSVEEDTVTVKAILGKAKKQTLTFKLDDKTKDCTLTPAEGVTVEKEDKTGNTKVNVPAKVGSYSLKLSRENAETNLTINVIDVTMPETSKISAQEVRDDDKNTVPDETVRENTKDIALTTPVVAKKATYSGNVNKKIASDINDVNGKYYRARFKVEKYDNKNLKAYNQDTMKELKVEPVDNTDNEIYVYLNSNIALTNLVIAVKDATEEQIKAQTPYEITFNSTSILWIDHSNASANDDEVADDNKGILISPITTHSGDSIGRNMKSEDGPITHVSLDTKDEKVIHVGAKFDALESFELDPKTFGIKAEQNSDNKAPWISIQLRVINHEDKEHKNTSISCDSKDIILDNGTEVKSNVNVNHHWRSVRVWLKADKEEDINFTLKYTKDGEVIEELPLTIKLHDSSKVKAVEAKVADGVNAVGTRGVVVNAADSKITLDTYKYAMDNTVSEIVDGEPTTGRFYKMNIKTNVPVDSLVQEEGGKWVDIKNKVSDYEFQVLMDANDANAKTIKLGNKYGKVAAGVPDQTSNQTEVTIKPVEKSRLELLHSSDTRIFGSELKNAVDHNALYNLDVKGLSRPYGGDTTLTHNLKAVNAEGSTKMIRKYDAETEINTVTYNIKDFEQIYVNGVLGKWVPLYICVRDDENLTTNTIDGVMFVDKNNDSTLLNHATCQKDSEQWDYVPVWFNLDSEDMQKYVTDPDEKDSEALELQLYSSNPDETNTLKIKFVNTSKAPIIEEVKEPEPAIDLSKYGEEPTQQQLNDLIQYFYDDTSNHDTDTPAEKGKKLLRAAQIIEEGEISEPKVIDDAIYITVKADLQALERECKSKNNARITIPMQLDVSMLKYKKVEDLLVWSGSSGKWWAPEVDHMKLNGDYLAFRLDFDAKSKDPYQASADNEMTAFSKGEKVVKTIIITDDRNVSSNGTAAATEAVAMKNLQDKNASFVKYVIDFVQK